MTTRGNKYIKKALMRPLDYEILCYRDQWEIDKKLGLLDWKPTLAQTKLYNKLRKKNVLKKP